MVKIGQDCSLKVMTTALIMMMKGSFSDAGMKGQLPIPAATKVKGSCVRGVGLPNELRLSAKDFQGHAYFCELKTPKSHLACSKANITKRGAELRLPSPRSDTVGDQAAQPSRYCSISEA